MGAATVLTVSYDGAPFAGFARQPSLPTVQGTLEEALRTVLRREVETVGAGRTDAGVHALGQVVSFASAEGDPDAASLLRSLGALAGPHVAVREVSEAPEGFSARHDALGRSYVYRFAAGPVPPVFLRGRAWWVKGLLDVPAMERSAAALLGRHDFRSFCAAQSADLGPTVREIDSLCFERAFQLGESCLELTVEGRSFLHSMVRVIAGTLVEVGKGRKPESWPKEALEALDRSAAGPTAPPEGLTLAAVRYPEGLLRRLAP